MTFLYIFTFIIFITFACFIFFEGFLAKGGKFRKTRISLLISLSIFLLIFMIGFISATVYMAYNHEHYRRGIIKIGNMIKGGHSNEAIKAIERYKNEPMHFDAFSLDASLAIHKIIDEEVSIEKHPTPLKNDEGNYTVIFNTPYYFGDFVEFDSALNGSGKGHIEAITVNEDRTVDYIIDCGETELQGGIAPGDIKKGRKRKTK